MWCKQCRQDVPALLSGDRQSLCCPRCGDGLCAKSPDGPDGRAAYDSWESDEQLRHIGRILTSGNIGDDKSSTIYRREAAEIDASHAGPPAWHVQRTGQRRKTRKSRRKSKSASGALIAVSMSLGSVGFVCGAVLLGWSLATGRKELWSIGLPVAMAGQVSLLVGLVFQLDRLWRDSRNAARKLNDVDEQLHELKTTATLLEASRGPAASVFYSHFAGGAGPHLLLTDLKSQLDLLAMKIAQDER